MVAMTTSDKENKDTLIKATCTKCGHSAEILLPYEKRRETDKLICSQCLAKGPDLRVEYLRDLKEMY